MVKIMVYCVLSILLSVAPTGKIAATMPAFYIFGDSTVDVGNNNYLSGKAPKANFPYYGIDYPHSVPTGRFSNGFLAIDYMARALGFRESPPPFLSLNKDVRQMLRGVNFASAGSGILNTTGEDVISFDAQIDNFATVVANLSTRIGRHATAHLLSKSLFYLSIGSNDLFDLYYHRRPTNSSQKDQIVNTLINKYRDQLKLLYKLGARKFAVTGTGLVGNIPAVNIPVVKLLYPGIVEDLNDLSSRFKFANNALLEALGMELDGFYYSFGDAYEFGLQVFADPSRFGILNVTAACCGSGELNAEEMCAPNTTHCANPDQYYNWDRIHPSQIVYKLISNKLLSGALPFVNPINIYQLMSLPFNINEPTTSSFILMKNEQIPEHTTSPTIY